MLLPSRESDEASYMTQDPMDSNLSSASTLVLMEAIQVIEGPRRSLLCYR